MKNTKLKNILTVAAIILIVLFIIFGLRYWNHSEEITAPENINAPEHSEHIITKQHEVLYTPEEENLSRYISISPVYRNFTMKTNNGEDVPSIMCEDIIKSNYRKSVTEDGEEPVYMSGPRISINGKIVPDGAFYASFDHYDGEVEYIICAKCFQECGFRPNSNVTVTPYDVATINPDHNIWIGLDELEIHTTWQLDQYDPDSNTYYFTVTQNGPFSGTSNIFGVYKDGDRYNTMPKENSVLGTRLVEYDALNNYWAPLNMNRNKLIVKMNDLYNTNYSQLAYTQDVGAMTIEEWLEKNP